jgi:hypothetical protein
VFFFTCGPEKDNERKREREWTGKEDRRRGKEESEEKVPVSSRKVRRKKNKRKQEELRKTEVKANERRLKKRKESK